MEWRRVEGDFELAKLWSLKQGQQSQSEAHLDELPAAKCLSIAGRCSAISFRDKA